MTTKLMTGDVLKCLAKLPDESVQCVVTSPPYWGLRDYGTAGQLGLEPTPEEFVAKLVAVFREVRRVLRPDGTCWVNLGDSYFGGGGEWAQPKAANGLVHRRAETPAGHRSKNLVGIPWRVAFALQADGWYLRSDIIWAKTNPMPESVRDRPTKSHEYIFLLTKRARYYYDAEAVKEAQTGDVRGRTAKAFPKSFEHGHGVKANGSFHSAVEGHKDLGGRNARSVWTITPKPFKGAHFATFPPALVERCVKAGSRPGDLVLDPFSGAGTVAMVAGQLGRDAVGIDLNPAYNRMARARIAAAKAKAAA